jgi:hypothetical protein
VLDREPAELRCDARASLGLDCREALAHSPPRRVDLDERAGLGVDERQVADVRQLGLARVADLDRHHRVVGGQRAERPDPLVLVAEVGDDDDEPGLGRHSTELHERVRQRTRIAGAIRRDAGRQRPPHRHRPRLRRARRQKPRLAGAERAERDAPGATHRQARDDDRGAVGDVALQPLGRAERHRRRAVDDDPGRERSLRHVQADVRLAHARGGGGVDLAYVVADLVRAQLCQLGPAPDAGGQPVAGQHPARSARDHQVELLDDVARDRPGPLAGRGDLQAGLRHAASACGSDSGRGTAPRTRSRISSTTTPSLRPS